MEPISPEMESFNVRKFLEEGFGQDTRDLVTRHSGRIVRGRIEKLLEQGSKPAVVALDFSEVGVIDYSGADEIVARLISRLLGGEYGEKYLLLVGLNENQRENIEVALERKHLPVMAVMRDGKRVLLGSLNNYLKETLQAIVDREKITAKDLSGMMNLEANTSGTRLLNLHKKRLVKRSEKILNGGRIWVYERL